MAATHRTALELVVAGRRLAAVRIEPEGSRAGPTLLFLHEGLGCIGFWKDVPDLLCGRLRLRGLVWDRCGYGASDPCIGARPLDYLSREAEQALPALLAAAGIERPVLIGHSDGGTIALLFAAAFPERPVALVTLAAHVVVEDITVAGIRAAVRSYESGELRRRLERFHGARAETVFRAWADTWLDPRFRSWDVTGRLRGIVAPLLVLQGCDDEYGTPHQVEAIAAGVRGPVESVLLPACGHVPHHQARAPTLEAIGDFLRRHVAAGEIVETIGWSSRASEPS